jgi:hypothetical protein
VVVPNLADTFNQGAKAVVTPSGRVVVSWLAFQFVNVPNEHRIETAFSDHCRLPGDACTFSAPLIVDRVNPQGTPPGDTRILLGDLTVDNRPSIAVDKGRDDGRITRREKKASGFGNVYITYFDGKTPFDAPLCDPFVDPSCVPFASAANILVSRSIDSGKTFRAPVKVNDDPGDTAHVFPSAQVNKFGEVFVTWIDRRRDNPRNLLNDTWGDISGNNGKSFGRDGRISTASSDWVVRADWIPNFGNYNSSEVVGFTHFLSIWSDGRFPRPAPITAEQPPFERPPEESATPDTRMGIVTRGDRDK